MSLLFVLLYSVFAIHLTHPSSEWKGASDPLLQESTWLVCCPGSKEKMTLKRRWPIQIPPWRRQGRDRDAGRYWVFSGQHPLAWWLVLPKVDTISKTSLCQSCPSHQGWGWCTGPGIRRSARIEGASKGSARSRIREREIQIWCGEPEDGGEWEKKDGGVRYKANSWAFSSRHFSGPPLAQRMTSLHLECLVLGLHLELYI